MAASLLITNVTVLDGRGGEPLRDGAVLCHGDRIEWVGPASSSPNGSDLPAVDGGGSTLLPGLIDCHTHLCHDGPIDLFGQARDDSASMGTLRAAASVRQHLEAGVTTARDCGAAGGIAIEVGRAVERGMIPGCRVQAAGRVVTMTGGHGYFIGREADGPDEVRKAARAELKEGAQLVKVMATGGVLTPGVVPTQTALGLEELRAAAEEAHNAGKRTASHSIGNQGIKNALRAGIDSIEHGFYLDDEAIELFLSTGAFLVPTLIAVEQIIRNGLAAGIPEWIVQKAESEAGHHKESFGMAARAGVRIASGTDAGTPFNRHGDLAQEIALMVEYGLPLAKAVPAATSMAAQNLGLEHKLGTVEVGKVADLVLLDGDPTTDVAAFARVRAVVKGGELVRSELAAGVPQPA